MNVLQVLSSFPPAYSYGGPVHVAYQVSKGLVKRGHEVTVFTTDILSAKSRVKSPNHATMDGIEIYRFCNFSNYLASQNLSIAPGMALALNRAIKSFDLVHLHEFRSFQAALVHHYAVEKNVPYLLQPHGSLPRIIAKQRLKRAFDLICGFKILKDARLAIALTEAESTQFKRMGMDERRIRIIPNAIDLGYFSNLPEAGTFKMKHGLKSEDKLVLYLGRIHKIKGIELLLEAFSSILEELPSAKLVIVGPDDGSVSVLKKQIEQTPMNGCVKFIGPLYGRAKLEAYVDAEVYVLPSRYDTFPLTVLEASACRTPVIMTDKCGVAHLFERYGLVVQRDVAQLRDVVYKLLIDDAKRRELGLEMFNLVVSNFTWEKIITKVETAYRDVLREK